MGKIAKAKGRNRLWLRPKRASVLCQFNGFLVNGQGISAPREQDLNCDQIEKPKNEMISRRGEEVVAPVLRRRSRNAEISHFLASLRASEFPQVSSLFVAHASKDTYRSSRLESCGNSLRSIDRSSNPAP